MSVRVGDLVGAPLGEAAMIVSPDPNGARASACADALAHQGCNATIEGANPSSYAPQFNMASVRDRGIPSVQVPALNVALRRDGPC